MDEKSKKALIWTLNEMEKELDSLRCKCTHKISEHEKGKCEACDCTCVVNMVWSVTGLRIAECFDILDR